MRAQFILLVCNLCPVSITKAQPPKTPPREFPTTIPKHEAARIKANVQQIIKPAFITYLTTVEWKGARIWYAANNATVDSVTTIKFNLDGSVTWQKQGWEYVNKTTGFYNVSGNNMTIQFDYAPYKHSFQGNYNETTGKITGSFTETRSASQTAPPAYMQGITTGEFNFYKK